MNKLENKWPPIEEVSDEYVTVAQAAHYLGLSVDTLRSWSRQYLPPIKPVRSVRLWSLGGRFVDMWSVEAIRQLINHKPHRYGRKDTAQIREKRVGENKVIAVNGKGIPVGEYHHRAKYSDRVVEQVRRLRDQGLSYPQIAEKMEMPYWTVSRICRHERRAEIPARFKKVET